MNKSIGTASCHHSMRTEKKERVKEDLTIVLRTLSSVAEHRKPPGDPSPSTRVFVKVIGRPIYVKVLNIKFTHAHRLYSKLSLDLMVLIFFFF